MAVWCSHNNMELNTLKTLEMILDIRRKKPHVLQTLTIMDRTVAAVKVNQVSALFNLEELYTLINRYMFPNTQ